MKDALRCWTRWRMGSRSETSGSGLRCRLEAVLFGGIACLLGALLVSQVFGSPASGSTLDVIAAAARTGGFGLRLTLTPCSTVPVLDVSGPPINVSATFEACNRLSSDVVIEPPADVTLRSGRQIDLSAGFQVRPGATLTTEIVPALSTVAYVQDAKPTSESRYHVRWYADLTQLLVATDTVDHFVALDHQKEVVFRLLIDRATGQDRLRLVVEQPGSSPVSTAPVPIGAGWRAVEIEWRAASSPAASDGLARLFLDDVEVASLTGIANGSHRVEAVRLGASGFVDGSSSGILDIDSFASRNDGHIGL